MKHIQLNEDDYNIIPITWYPTKFYSITFEGWNDFSFVEDDEILNIILELSSKTIHSFHNIYKHTHAFTQPQFCLKPNGTFIIKIGTLEMEEYERRKTEKVKGEPVNYDEGK